METQRAELTDSTAIADFILGGRATFTLVSGKTGSRFTFKVQAPHTDRRDGRAGFNPKTGPWFVKVLTGPDNESSYRFLGVLRIRDGKMMYAHGRKSKITPEAMTAKTAMWFFNNLGVDANATLAMVQFWHEGRCGRCGRTLTVPDSIAIGLGPVCASRAM